MLFDQMINQGSILGGRRSFPRNPVNTRKSSLHRLHRRLLLSLTHQTNRLTHHTARPNEIGSDTRVCIELRCVCPGPRCSSFRRQFNLSRAAHPQFQISNFKSQILRRPGAWIKKQAHPNRGFERAHGQPTLTAFNPSAQGCEEGATLGFIPIAEQL
jgi:hypothetical protein